MDFIDFIEILYPHICQEYGQQDRLAFFCELITSPKEDSDLNDDYTEAIHKYQNRSQKSAVSEIFNKNRPFPNELMKLIKNHFDVSRLIEELEKINWGDEQELVITAFRNNNKKISKENFINDIINVLNEIIGKPNSTNNKTINNFYINQSGDKGTIIAHADKIELTIGGNNGRNKNNKK